MIAKLPHRHLSPYKGKAVYTFNVVVRQSGIDWQHEETIAIVSQSAAEAVNFIRDILAPRVEYPTEIETTGPKGGIVHRFIGWESLIGARMFRARDRQLTFNIQSQ